MKGVVRIVSLGLALAPALAACHRTPPAEDTRPGVDTELRREQDCADPQWKAANLGLWYNLCQKGGAASQ